MKFEISLLLNPLNLLNNIKACQTCIKKPLKQDILFNKLEETFFDKFKEKQNVQKLQYSHKNHPRMSLMTIVSLCIFF